MDKRETGRSDRHGLFEGEFRVGSTSESKKNSVFVCAIIFIEPEAINICFLREKYNVH